MLQSLESFLATFQHDLSAVSGHISDLQSRSKSIDSRLTTRKVSSQCSPSTRHPKPLTVRSQALEMHLSPVVASLTIPPELIDVILNTEPGLTWLPAIAQLEAKLTAIRSGPRVTARKSLDDAADKLRIKVTLSFACVHRSY